MARMVYLCDDGNEHKSDETGRFCIKCKKTAVDIMSKKPTMVMSASEQVEWKVIKRKNLAESDLIKAGLLWKAG